MVLSVDMAALIGFGCEALFYGAYCVVFILSITFLIWRRRTRSISYSMLTATCILFSACTAHFALEFNHFYITLSTTGVVLGYANETPVLFAADTLISVADVLGQAVLLYRCWLAWERNYAVIALPLITSLAGLACIGAVVQLLLHIDPTASTAPPALIPLGTAGYVLPLCTNVLITSLIVFRIWAASRTDSPIHTHPSFTTSHSHSRPSTSLTTTGGLVSTSTATAAQHVSYAMAIVIESGMLYLIVQLIFVVLFAIGHPAQGILAVIAVQIYGIAPTLILFRVALGVSSPAQQRRRGGGNNNHNGMTRGRDREEGTHMTWGRQPAGGDGAGTFSDDRDRAFLSSRFTGADSQRERERVVGRRDFEVLAVSRGSFEREGKEEDEGTSSGTAPTTPVVA